MNGRASRRFGPGASTRCPVAAGAKHQLTAVAFAAVVGGEFAEIAEAGLSSVAAMESASGR